MSNSEIAASLFLSEGTVKIHVGRILAKLGLPDPVQAAVLAYESRLITPGTPLTPGTPPPDRPGHPNQLLGYRYQLGYRYTYAPTVCVRPPAVCAAGRMRAPPAPPEPERVPG